MTIRGFIKSCHHTRSIRFQLVLAVNLVMVVAISLLISLRYFNEMKRKISEKHVTLNDEAATIHTAVNHLWHNHDVEAVQKAVDDMCRRMRVKSLPCHRVVVRKGQEVIQSQLDSHLHDKRHFVEVNQSSKKPEGRLGDQGFAAGSYSAEGVSVFVTENLDDVRREIRHDIITQLVVLGLLGLVATSIVNIILWRIVEAPMRSLLTTVNQIGEGKLGAENSTVGSHEIQQLSEAVNSMSRRLLESGREREVQMRKAQEIQQHLLPNGVIIPGLQAAHIFEPADEVAGDYYDFLPLGDGSWMICVADVTGHGVPAAMGAAMLKSLLLAACEQPPFDPVSILEQINRRFVRTVLPGNFASMFLARWQPSSRDFCWASAGHEPGILQTSSGEMILLNSSGLLLGLDSNAEWSLNRVILQDEDRILLFSDGATDAMSPEGELFSRNRLARHFRSYGVSLTADEVVGCIRKTLDEHREGEKLTDDLTLVMLQCREAGKADLSSNYDASVQEAHQSTRNMDVCDTHDIEVDQERLRIESASPSWAS